MKDLASGYEKYQSNRRNLCIGVLFICSRCDFEPIRCNIFDTCVHKIDNKNLFYVLLAERKVILQKMHFKE